jgi:predicted Zn-dependent protease
MGVMGRCRDWLRGLQRHPRRLLLAGLLVVLGSWGLYLAGRHLWAEYHYRAARQAVDAYDFTRARAHLERCLRVWPASAPTHLLAAQAARRAGALTDAERHLKRCQDLEDNPDFVLREWNMLRAQRGELNSQVEGYLLSCLQQQPADAALLLEALARGYLRIGRLGDARRSMERLLELRPDTPQLLVWYGEILEHFGRLDLAVKAYQQALDLDPDNDWCRLCLAEKLLYRAQPAAAAAHFEVLLHRLPGNAAVRLGLARCRRQCGQPEEARQLLDALAAEQPDEAIILSERGKLALDLGELADAEDWLRRALARMPHDRQTAFALYQCLAQRGQTQEAQKYLAQVEALDADRKRLAELTEQVIKAGHAPALRCELGLVCFRLGQEQDGLRWLISALVDDPTHAPTHRALADYYQRIGQAERAAYHRQRGG